MVKVVDGLYQSGIDIWNEEEKDEKPLIKTAAYLLVGESENSLFYSSKYIEDDFPFIAEKGELSFQFLNHRHEASSFSDKVKEKFNAPLICHHLEKKAVEKESQVDQVISGGEIFGHITAIHTPGHCPGSTCFLVKRNGGNILFSGDTFYPMREQWRVSIFDGKQEEMIQSLKKLLDLEVSLIVPSLYVDYPPFGWFENQKKYQLAIKDCISRLEQGKTN